MKTFLCILLIIPSICFGQKIDVYFSPNGGCTQAICGELREAKKQVLIQAYSFTSKEIAEALKDCSRRGVKVVGMFDDSNMYAKYSMLPLLDHSGVQVWIDKKCAIAHSKVIIIDGTVLITGSFNFTAAAEKSNVENLLIIKDCKDLINKYMTHYSERLMFADPYVCGNKY